jgi:hypothetical protein
MIAFSPRVNAPTRKRHQEAVMPYRFGLGRSVFLQIGAIIA